MVHDRRIVSFVTQNVQRRDRREDGDGYGLLVVRPQSVFSRLGPKVSGDVCDPPYVPQSVGNLPLPGMIFGCTSETYNECLTRQLFGLPGKVHKPQVCLSFSLSLASRDENEIAMEGALSLRFEPRVSSYSQMLEKAGALIERDLAK